MSENVVDWQFVAEAWQELALKYRRENIDLKEQIERLEARRDLWQRLQADRLVKFFSNQDTGDEQQ